MGFFDGGFGGIIGGIGSIAGGLLGSSGASDANKANAQLARDVMAFQERMSSTAYQRAMEDMRKAGLNPILAYQRGGASTPTGSLATMQNELAPLGAGISGAASAYGAMQQAIRVGQENEKFRKFGSGTWADKADTFVKTLGTTAKEIDRVNLPPPAGTNPNMNVPGTESSAFDAFMRRAGSWLNRNFGLPLPPQSR